MWKGRRCVVQSSFSRDRCLLIRSRYSSALSDLKLSFSYLQYLTSQIISLAHSFLVSDSNAQCISSPSVCFAILQPSPQRKCNSSNNSSTKAANNNNNSNPSMPRMYLVIQSGTSGLTKEVNCLHPYLPSRHFCIADFLPHWQRTARTTSAPAPSHACTSRTTVPVHSQPWKIKLSWGRESRYV